MRGGDLDTACLHTGLMGIRQFATCEQYVDPVSLRPSKRHLVRVAAIDWWNRRSALWRPFQ
jgi:hypothetical protein